MKVSKKQLKRIIKEEKAKLQEVGYHGSALEAIKKELVAELYVMDPNEMRAEIYSLIDELENMARVG